MPGFPFPARQELARRRLCELAQNPPQVLLIEGGLSGEREAMALYYAARLNCAAPDAPCGVCPSCVQVRDKVHLDLIYLDGQSGYIKVDEIREVRQKVSEPPRGPGWRVVLMAGARNLTTEAANALLKSMEEPRPGNCFVFLAPQRERILPTLVSRAWVLTLAWPDRTLPEIAVEGEDVNDWLAALAGFWSSGRGWFERTASRGRTTRALAELLVLACGRELAVTLCGAADSPMSGFLAANLNLSQLRRFDVALGEAQESLVLMVNPALVLDWLATRVYCWLRENGQTR